jgi:hypothetical protein
MGKGVYGVFEATIVTIRKSLYSEAYNGLFLIFWYWNDVEGGVSAMEMNIYSF